MSIDERWLPMPPDEGPPLPKSLGIYWPWYKAPEGGSATLAIRLGTGPVTEGQTTPLTVKVTNTSTQDDQPVAASLTTKIGVATTDGTVVLAIDTKTDSFTAGGSKTYNYTLTAPLGKGGQSLGVAVAVYDPNGNAIASGGITQPIVAIQLSGSFASSLIYYDGIPSAGWEVLQSGGQVPSGVPIYLAMGWFNSSSVSMVGHVDLTMDGVAVAASQNQDSSATPGKGYSVRFDLSALATGTHTFAATLSSQGKVLSSLTFTLVAAAAPIIYAATVVVT